MDPGWGVTVGLNANCVPPRRVRGRSRPRLTERRFGFLIPKAHACRSPEIEARSFRLREPVSSDLRVEGAEAEASGRDVEMGVTSLVCDSYATVRGDEPAETTK